MEFFMNMVPPTVTAQMKKAHIVKGRVFYYEPKNVAAARELLSVELIKHRPEKEMEGPLALYVEWRFPKGKSHKEGEWRMTRPDTDNIEKMLKDCMTHCGFWKDDAQVAVEHVEKKWSDDPTGILIRITELEDENE